MNFELTQIFYGMGIGVLILLGILFWKSWFKVDEGHAAVLTNFGAALFQNKKSQDLIVFKPGIHFKKPWEKPINYSTMERVLDLSGSEKGRHAMTADGTVLRLDSKIRFYPSQDRIYSYLFELKNPMEHIKEMFTCLLRNEIANFSSEVSDEFDFVGSYSEIRRDRSRLNKEMETFCNNHIGKHYGVKFSGVDLIDILPPQELETALNAIQNAKTEATTIYSRAEADSRQKIASAQRGVQIAKIKAEAAAVEIETQAATLLNMIEHGNFNNYIRHRKTELLGDSRMTFVQQEN